MDIYIYIYVCIEEEKEGDNNAMQLVVSLFNRFVWWWWWWWWVENGKILFTYTLVGKFIVNMVAIVPFFRLHNRIEPQRTHSKRI